MMLAGGKVFMYITFFARYKVTKFANKFRHFSQSGFDFQIFPIFEREKVPKPFSYILWKMSKSYRNVFFDFKK